MVQNWHIQPWRDHERQAAVNTTIDRVRFQAKRFGIAWGRKYSACQQREHANRKTLRAAAAPPRSGAAYGSSARAVGSACGAGRWARAAGYNGR